LANDGKLISPRDKQVAKATKNLNAQQTMVKSKTNDANSLNNHASPKKLMK
jgi:hypothetical protein